MTKKTLPTFVPPMMAESAKAPFDSNDWIFEIKLDGYRAITVFDSAGKAHLWSRNGLSLEAKFPAIANAVSKLKLRSTVLDVKLSPLTRTGFLAFSFCKGSKNSRPPRPCTMSSTSFGVRETTSRRNRSWNGEES